MHVQAGQAQQMRSSHGSWGQQSRSVAADYLIHVVSTMTGTVCVLVVHTMSSASRAPVDCSRWHSLPRAMTSGCRTCDAVAMPLVAPVFPVMVH
jgi:hypothetical protein